MDKNTFLLHRTKLMAAKTHAQSKKQVPEQSQSKQINEKTDKYNPDVLQKYTNQEKNRKLNVEFVPVYYKTITNQPIKTITKVEDLQLEKDKPDINKSINDYNTMLNNRTAEKEQMKQSIYEYKKKHNIRDEDINKEKKKENIKTNLPISNVIYTNEGQSHNRLRSDYEKYAVAENDKITEQKKRYNNILQSLSDIL
jgi:DNA gyrase/topoisomerase IV subunit A